MLRKLPIALFIAALLIAIPGVWSIVNGDDPAAAAVLTPGADDVRSAADRAAFWEGRIAGDSDWLNRVHAGAAILEAARQSGDQDTYDAALAMAEDAASLHLEVNGEDTIDGFVQVGPDGAAFSLSAAQPYGGFSGQISEIANAKATEAAQLRAVL